MTSKDQTIGALIFLFSATVAIGYIVSLFAPNFLISLLSPMTTLELSSVRYWLIAAPVLVALVAVLLIGSWIGWAMATTPPPKPIEEIETKEVTEDT